MKILNFIIRLNIYLSAGVDRLLFKGSTEFIGFLVSLLGMYFFKNESSMIIIYYIACIYAFVYIITSATAIKDKFS